MNTTPRQFLKAEWTKSGDAWPSYQGEGPRYTHASGRFVIQGYVTRESRTGRRRRKPTCRSVRVYWLEVDGRPSGRATTLSPLLEQAADGLLAGRVTVHHDGVVRWNSNGRVPFADCREKLQAEGVQFDEQASAAAKKAEDAAALAEYASRPRDDSPEAQFERLAAFGPGQVIVDVLSGHRYET